MVTSIIVNLNYTIVVRICQEGMKKGIFTESWWSKKGLRQSAKKLHAEGA